MLLHTSGQVNSHTHKHRRTRTSPPNLPKSLPSFRMDFSIHQERKLTDLAANYTLEWIAWEDKTLNWQGFSHLVHCSSPLIWTPSSRMAPLRFCWIWAP